MNASDQPAVTESSGRTWRLAFKELREILRDRRTVLTLVLMPLLVYPLLGVIMRKGVLSGLPLGGKVQVIVCFETTAEAEAFEFEMSSGRTLLDTSGEPATDPEESSVSSLTSTAKQTEFTVYTLNEGVSVRDAVQNGSVDLGIRITTRVPPEDAGRRPRPFRQWEIVRQTDSALGAQGYKEITKRLEAVNENYIDLLLDRHDLSNEKPQLIVDSTIDSEARNVPALITFIPLVLVLMTMTGAVYPAIDLTAGERERGTMEILVAAPVSRMTLLAGKFLAVLVVALLTTTMNLVSMFATLFALGLEGTVLGSVGPTVMIQVGVLMVVFAAFFSAVLLSITSIARSFKEAQAYLIPLMLISLTPGVFSLLPNVQINGVLAVTPLVNTVLMARDLLVGDVNLLVFAIVLISTALYGVLALSLAARIFGSDAVLYGSSGSWTELFRRPNESADTASIPVSMVCLAMVFSLFIIVGPLPGRFGLSPQKLLLANSLISIVLFVVIPAVVSLVAKVRLASGFSVRLPTASSWLAALLLGLSLWPFVYEIEIALLTDARIDQLKQFYESIEFILKSVPLWAKLLSLAVAPAVCEEFFFRGFLQNSIRRRASAPLSILAAGVLFGLFHVIVKDALLFERLVPSTLMGIVLGIVYERSGSVFPGMMLHVIHNGLLVAVAEYEESLIKYGIGISNHQHLPAGCLAVAGLAVVAAFVVLMKTPEVTANEERRL